MKAWLPPANRGFCSGGAKGAGRRVARGQGGAPELGIAAERQKQRTPRNGFPNSPVAQRRQETGLEWKPQQKGHQAGQEEGCLWQPGEG